MQLLDKAWVQPVEVFKENNHKLFEVITSEVKSSVTNCLNKLLEAEIDIFLGQADQSTNKKNGSYEREFSIKGVGCIRLRMPRDRNSNFKSTIVTVAKKIDKLESEIKWNLKAIEIHNQVRALTMGPSSYTLYNGKKLKIHKTTVSMENSEFGFSIQTQQYLKNYLEGYQKRKSEKSDEAGTILQVTDEYIRVQTGFGYIDLLEVQPESRNRMRIKDFLQGNDIKQGLKLV